MAELVILTDR